MYIIRGALLISSLEGAGAVQIFAMNDWMIMKGSPVDPRKNLLSNFEYVGVFVSRTYSLAMTRILRAQRVFLFDEHYWAAQLCKFIK